MNPQTALDRRSQVLSRLKQWILDKHPGLQTIADDEDLLESQLINSLQFISMLMCIEELRGRDIDQDQVELECFRTLNGIYENFFQESPHV
jgi:hypothetical protein